MAARKFARSLAWKQQQERASREGAHPDIVRFAFALVNELHKYDVPFFAHEFLRGQVRQEAMYQQGHSKARFGSSAHNYGMAVDLVHSLNGWNLTKREWALVGILGKVVAKRLDLDVTWGGDFKSLYDPAHWELTAWRQLKDLPQPLTVDQQVEEIDYVIKMQEHRKA